MNFKYRIDNNEAIITGLIDDLIDDLVNSVIIPEFIGDLPVTGIAMDSFCWLPELKYITIPKSVLNIHCDAFPYNSNLISINNIGINKLFCVINNRHVWYDTDVFKIIYQIGGDYMVGGYSYFINNKRVSREFNII